MQRKSPGNKIKPRQSVITHINNIYSNTISLRNIPDVIRFPKTSPVNNIKKRHSQTLTMSCVN